MSLLKVEGVSNDVFIPEHLSQEDQAFIVERTENIFVIGARAGCEIGLELLVLELHFRDKREFAGTNGWYEKYLRSLGISREQHATYIAAARLVLDSNVSQDIVNAFPSRLLRALKQPSLLSAVGTVSGASQALINYTVDAVTLRGQRPSNVMASDIKHASRSAVNQILAAEQIVEDKKEAVLKAQQEWEERPEGLRSEDYDAYHALQQRVGFTNKSLQKAQDRLKSLESEKLALEAKYDDWRSPEAIKQELDEAIEKARAEERAKKVAKKDNTAELDAAKSLLVSEKNAKLELERKLKEMAQQVEELRNRPAPEPDIESVKAIAKAELEGEVAVKIKEIEMLTKQQLEVAEEKVRKAEAAKRSAQNSKRELQDELELAQQNTPKTPEWVLSTITNHITNFKTACDEFNGIKRQDGKSGELTDMDQYAVEAMQHWIASFSPSVRDQVILMLQSQTTVQNTLTSTTISQIIDV